MSTKYGYQQNMDINKIYRNINNIKFKKVKI